MQNLRKALIKQQYKSDVEADYLSKYGYTFDQVLVNNPYTFDTVKQVSATPHESTLCNVFSDAYKRAVEQATGKKVDVAITAAGVIRGSLPVGQVTVSDVFNAASLGVGTEGELWGDFKDNKLYYQRFCEDVQSIDLKALCDDFTGHGGGDARLVYDVVRYLRGDEFDTSSMTVIDRSVESHYLAFAAEKSRVLGGELLKLDDFKKEIGAI